MHKKDLETPKKRSKFAQLMIEESDKPSLHVRRSQKLEPVSDTLIQESNSDEDMSDKFKNKGTRNAHSADGLSRPTMASTSSYISQRMTNAKTSMFNTLAEPTVETGEFTMSRQTN